MSEAVAKFSPMLGADPELFLKHGRSKVAAYGLIGGTKKEPIQMPDMEAGFLYQEDGAAFEFNIPPARSSKQFVRSIESAGIWIKTFLDDKELKISSANHIKLNKRDLEHPLALEIGCVEDYCAYLPKGARKRIPFTAADLGDIRYAGGHFHVQFNHEMVAKHAFVKICDAAIMLASVVFDKQGGRRKFYGCAGIYRDKEYGVELRSLSNFWATELILNGAMHSSVNSGNGVLAAARHQFAFNIPTYLFKLAEWTNDPRCVDKLGEVYVNTAWNDVQAAINNEDVKLATQIMEMLRVRYRDYPFICVNSEGYNI